MTGEPRATTLVGAAATRMPSGWAAVMATDRWCWTMGDPLLTAAEVADELRVSTMTVYRLVRRGELPAVRVGRNYRIRRRDLLAYLEGQAVDPASVKYDEAADTDAR